MEDELRRRCGTHVRELLLLERWSRFIVRYAIFVIEWRLGYTLEAVDIPVVTTTRLNPWYALRIGAPPSVAVFESSSLLSQPPEAEIYGPSTPLRQPARQPSRFQQQCWDEQISSNS